MKGLIFDLDGTMVDNMMVHHRAWQRKLRELGLDLPLDEVQKKVHGINEEILERLFGETYSPVERVRISREKEEEYRRIFKPDLRLIEGLAQFLVDLKSRNYPLAIGSAAPPENVNFVVDNLSIRDLFQVILHSRDVIKGKPDPEIYLRIIEQLGLTPEECLVFEDTPTGAEASWKAGCESIIITTTHEPREFQKFDNIRKFVKDYTEIDINRDLN